MEALSDGLLKESLKPKSGTGIELSTRSERIPYLLFADDCLLFCKANTTTCKRLKSLLDSFCAHSGQLINYHKSTLTFRQMLLQVADKWLLAFLILPKVTH